MLAIAALAAPAFLAVSTPMPAGAASRDDNRRPFRFKTLVTMHFATRTPVRPKIPCFVADIDLDGDDDLLVDEPDRLSWYKLHGDTLTLLRENAYERRGGTRMVTDGTGDGHPDFFFLDLRPEGVMLSLHDWYSPNGPSTSLSTIGPLLPLEAAGDNPANRIFTFGSFVAEKGGPRAILIGLNVLKADERCRSLLAYDALSGRRIWSYDFASASQELVWDSFGDAFPRIVFTTAAYGNGVMCEGTTDSVSHVICLDGRDGRLLWKIQLTGRVGRGYLALADVNGDGSQEILVARFFSKSDATALVEGRDWVVAALNRDGDILASAAMPMMPKGIRAADLDGDSSPEILVRGADGEIGILGAALDIRSLVSPSSNVEGFANEIFGAGDFVGDGRPEIVCRLDRALLLRNQRGAVIAERSFARQVSDSAAGLLEGPIDAWIARCDGENRIIAANGDSIQLLMLERTPLASRLSASRRPLAAWGAAGALAIVWATFHGRRVLKRRRDRFLSMDEAHNELLKAMAAFGHGGSSLKVIDRLRLHLKNWDRIHADGVTREELVARLRETYVETVVPEIKHIVMLARRARIPDGIWNSLQAEAGFAAEETEAILATGSEGDAYRTEHIAKALGALDGVDGSLAGIRLHLRSIFRTPVAEALGRLVKRFRYEHGARGISFALVCDSSTASDVFISPVTFDKIFESLLTNAVRATESRTDAEIAIAVQWEGNYCRIDVRDNGCGIPRDDWERAFERHYTTKPEGGGFGLYYAREELAKFGGKIYVLESAAGSGTTMRVVFRKSEKAGGA
jgi:signal transduction histidine kinase